MYYSRSSACRWMLQRTTVLRAARQHVQAGIRALRHAVRLVAWYRSRHALSCDNVRLRSPLIQYYISGIGVGRNCDERAMYIYVCHIPSLVSYWFCGWWKRCIEPTTLNFVPQEGETLVLFKTAEHVTDASQVLFTTSA
ncbi:hypothetical protein OH76DRAFT_823618 [Lentinus brumalis]|uniref:Uncharacterized protein n=1 Tax=Lentinus brumalis TaxID=2498619 RepID=A0A371D260_9APHY|nr:hypothetical protein OH76DRAFT_823618 [Polyporus brumalis]